MKSPLFNLFKSSPTVFQPLLEESDVEQGQAQSESETRTLFEHLCDDVIRQVMGHLESDPKFILPLGATNKRYQDLVYSDPKIDSYIRGLLDHLRSSKRLEEEFDIRVARTVDEVTHSVRADFNRRNLPNKPVTKREELYRLLRKFDSRKLEQLRAEASSADELAVAVEKELIVPLLGLFPHLEDICPPGNWLINNPDSSRTSNNIYNIVFFAFMLYSFDFILGEVISIIASEYRMSKLDHCMDSSRNPESDCKFQEVSLSTTFLIIAAVSALPLMLILMKAFIQNYYHVNGYNLEAKKLLKFFNSIANTSPSTEEGGDYSESMTILERYFESPAVIARLDQSIREFADGTSPLIARANQKQAHRKAAQEKTTRANAAQKRIDAAARSERLLAAAKSRVQDGSLKETPGASSSKDTAPRTPRPGSPRGMGK